MSNWQGGIIKKQGYVFVYNPNHPSNANKKGNYPYVKRSRLVMEITLGRFLKPTEIVHHINGIKDDDRPENLVVTTRSSHMSTHKTRKKMGSCKKCSKKTKDIIRGFCKKCYASWYYFNIKKLKKRPKKRYFRKTKPQ